MVRLAPLALFAAAVVACGGGGDPPGTTGCEPAACGEACGVVADGCGGWLGCDCAAKPEAPRCDAPSDDFCSDDGFCWLTPLPQGDDLRGVWGARADAIWVAGPAGAMLLWDGARARRVALPGGASADAVWGTAADDVWAVGTAVLHYDGRCWTDVGAPVPGLGLTAVHGTGPADVFAAGPNGVLHFDGTRWSALPKPPALVSSLWAVAPGRALVGARSQILEWNGERWLETWLPPEIRDVLQLWGTAPDDVWAAVELDPARCRVSCPTTSQALLHFDGSSWTRAGPEVAAVAVDAVTGDSPSDVWAFAPREAWHWDGARWTRHPLPTREGETALSRGPRAARAAPGGAVLAVGDAGAIYRLDGSRFTLAAGHGPVGGFTIATGTSARDAWFGPSGLGTSAGDPADLLHWDGAAFTRVAAGVDDILYDGFAAGPGDLWLNTYASGLLHLEGGRATPGALGTSGNLADVAGFGPRDLYWLERLWDGTWFNLARLWHWDGTSVSSVDPPKGAWEAISGTSGRDLWLTGSGCQGCEANTINDVLRWDGAAWRTFRIPGENGYAHAVWSSGAGDAWIVGYPGLVARVTAERVERLPPFGDGAIETIVGGGPDDLWAFGWYGLALRFDGARWSRTSSGTRQWLERAWRSPEGDLFVTGNGGAVLRRAAR